VVDRSGALKGKSNRVGLYKCYACRKPFIVKVGTIFEDSHIAMRDWLAAIHLICSSNKGISANQLSRTLGITLKSGWFLAHRIRTAMGEASPGGNGQLGGEKRVVEADETYVGGKACNRKGRIPAKHPVVSLVERDGRVRSAHVRVVNSDNLRHFIVENVSSKANLMTDDSTCTPRSGASSPGMAP
jgi:transposase-like protein